MSSVSRPAAAATAAGHAPKRRRPLAAALLLVVLVPFAAVTGQGANGTYVQPIDFTSVPLFTDLSYFRDTVLPIIDQWLAQVDDSYAEFQQAYYNYLHLVDKPCTSCACNVDPSPTADTGPQRRRLAQTTGNVSPAALKVQETFKANLAAIKSALNDSSNTWVSGPTYFTDLNIKDRKRFLGGGRGRGGDKGRRRLLMLSDWPDGGVAGAVTRRRLLQDLTPGLKLDWSMTGPAVKMQQDCGTCWAFVTTALAERAHYIATGQVSYLSEQQLVDCSKGNRGCKGGSASNTLQWVVGTSSGLDYATDYPPYIAEKQKCAAVSSPPQAGLSDYAFLPPNNETAMLEALAYGPIGAQVLVDDNWYNYRGGVYGPKDVDCNNPKKKPNHLVTIVGFGIDNSTGSAVPYWLVRNSWGRNWGQDGHMLLRAAMNVTGGMCQVSSGAFTVQSSDDPVPSTGLVPPPGCYGAVQAQVTGTTSLGDLAAQYHVSIADIQLQNSLTCVAPLTSGQSLLVDCSQGKWSDAFGPGQAAGACTNGKSDSPQKYLCPTGEYVVQFTVFLSNAAAPTSTRSAIGGLLVVCSGGGQISVLEETAVPMQMTGAVANMAGFASVEVWADGQFLYRLAGVGLSKGTRSTVACDLRQGEVVLGFSVGTYPGASGRVLNNLQFLCGNPFGSGTDQSRAASRLTGALPAYADARTGLACETFTVAGNATIAGVAAAFKVSAFELLRANPGAVDVFAQALPQGLTLFIPPCWSGGILAG